MIYFRYEQPRLMRIQKTKEIAKNLLTILLFMGIFMGGLIVLARVI